MKALREKYLIYFRNENHFLSLIIKKIIRKNTYCTKQNLKIYYKSSYTSIFTWLSAVDIGLLTLLQIPIDM